MKKLTVPLLALALVLMVGVPAAAKKGGIPGKPPTDEPVAGTSCADAYGSDYQHGLQTEDFTVELGGKGSGFPSAACIDVMASEGEWRVEVEIVYGTVRDLLLAPQDSFSPGDSCGGLATRNVTSGAAFVLPGPDHPNDLDHDGMVEAATVNSCGTRFAETIDGVVVEGVDPNTPDPLAFRVGMGSSKGTHIILHVDLPPTQE